jgi:NOL1/NOP2/fmu family ribosome biogenesis protein
LLQEGSLLVSNEVIRTRAGILSENITKWGYPNSIVTNNDPGDFERLPHFFDVILADVPCSGEGMFRKDPESIHQWSLNNVALCAERQQRIIANIWPSLKPGGLLIYSTCTYNTRENEENINKFIDDLGAEILPIRISPDLHISTPVNPHVYRFFPHKTNGEGFSIAVLRKNDDEPIRQIKNKSNKPQKQSIPDIKDRLINPDKFRIKADNNIITAFPIDLISEYDTIEAKLRIISAGIQIAEIKGKDLVPAQSSANSIQMNHEAFESIEVDYGTALSYLRKEALVLPPETPRSYILLKYKNIPLGFVKNVGNRANNLYPQDWRIRTGYLPDKPVEVLRFT